VSRPRRDQRGSATVLALGLVGVLAFATVLLSALGGVVADQRRVASAADLAALAGAGALQDGADPCAAARSSAARNGASLDSCRVDDQVVTVRVLRAAGHVLGRRLEVSSRSRAGPVSAGPGR
jgi:secretion/DNA translocation related TadE-like protein